MRGRRRERLRVESRVHDTNLRSVGEQNRCQVEPTILFECPAQIPRSFLRSFSLWARHPAETSAERNVRLGAAEFFPVASRQVRRVRKRRREGNEWAARVERRYTIQRTIRWLKNRCQVGPTIRFECSAQIPRSFLRSFSLWARVKRHLVCKRWTIEKADENSNGIPWFVLHRPNSDKLRFHLPSLPWHWFDA